MANKVISVFEHDTLSIGDKGFGTAHFIALTKFNDAHGGKYFRVGFNKITFGSYVGVIQVGTRTIEILPKADDNSEHEIGAKNKWQKALLAMLTKAGYLKTNPTDNAMQHSSERNLLDVYLVNFLINVQSIVKSGLVKKYRQRSTNSNSLKGRLLIDKQLRINMIHKERFYTQHVTYDSDHLLNQVIKKACTIVVSVTNNQDLRSEFSKLLLQFEHVDVWEGSLSQLDKIPMNRKSIHCLEALHLAIMIVKRFSPDQSAGRVNILALLFNMNTLFERFVLRCFKEVANEFSAYTLAVIGKYEIPFWKHKKIIPDIVFTYKKDETVQRFVIDTKWKIIKQDSPSDDDLRQIYTYNLQFGAASGILLYPKIDQENLGVGFFESMPQYINHEHSCQLYFADIFQDGIISTAFASDLLKNQFGLI
jgi:5-methylcytosine-specific restriction enzyme subunit McrC